VTNCILPATVRKKCHVILVWLSIACFSCIVAAAHADEIRETVFDVSPQRCVTLRQGQPCFVRVHFEWQSTEILDLCVYGLTNEKLKCWTSSSGGSTVLPQTLPGTTEYILINSEGVELNRATVAVSWVYRKKRSKRRWRLF